jgi:hypothetical protein
VDVAEIDAAEPVAADDGVRPLEPQSGCCVSRRAPPNASSDGAPHRNRSRADWRVFVSSRSAMAATEFGDAALGTIAYPVQH